MLTKNSKAENKSLTHSTKHLKEKSKALNVSLKSKKKVKLSMKKNWNDSNSFKVIDIYEYAENNKRHIFYLLNILTEASDTRAAVEKKCM